MHIETHKKAQAPEMKWIALANTRQKLKSKHCINSINQ